MNHVTALPEDQALPRSKLLCGSLLYVPHLYSTLGGVCTLCTHYLHMEIIYNINLFVSLEVFVVVMYHAT